MSCLAALLILSVTFILIFKGLQKISPENMLKIMSERADLEVKDVLYREVGGDDTKWEIRAEKASYRKKENQAFFDTVEVKLFLSDGRTVVMKADKGQLDTSTRDMKISGNVGITSGGGERIRTDYLHYSHGEKKLHTGAAVLMETPRLRIKGVGMTISLKNRDLALLSRVQARIK